MTALDISTIYQVAEYLGEDIARDITAALKANASRDQIARIVAERADIYMDQVEQMRAAS